MEKLRTDGAHTEYWDEERLAQHLNCTEKEARKIMDEIRKAKNISGYGDIEKEIILDYLEQKQLAQRQREARHQADLATVESVSILKEQVKALKEQVNILRDTSAASTATAQKAHIQSLVANFISAISLVLAIVAMVLSN